MPPKRIAAFTSTSQRTTLQYFRYRSPRDGPSSFLGDIAVNPGYEVAQAVLAGFRFQTASGPADVAAININVDPRGYDPATGRLEVSVSSAFSTNDPGPAVSDVTFVVILTRDQAASFTPIDPPSQGPTRPPIAVRVHGPASVPAGQHYIGTGVHEWQLGVDDRTVPLHVVSGHPTAVSVVGQDVDITYEGAIADAGPTNRMWMEWRASVIAFDPAEMAPGPNPTTAAPTSSFSGLWQRTRWQQVWAAPPGGRIVGVLDAFQGVSLELPGGQQGPVRAIEAAVAEVQIAQGGTGVAVDYGLHLKSPGQPFDAAMWRTVGLLL